MHDHTHHHDTTGTIKVAFFLNLTFALLEVIGGLWTNSLAILSDALHDLGDCLSLGLSWHLEGVSQRKRDARYSYGYRRFSLLAALINTVILIGGSLLILIEAIPRLLAPEPTNAPGMVLFAVGGILVNGIAVLRMRGGQSLNAQLVSWHLLEDLLGWIAVLIVSLVLLVTDTYVLDPLLSLLIAAYILVNVLRQLHRTLKLFLQGVPDGLSVETIEAQLLALEHVESVHHTHLWSLDGEHHVLTTHLVVAAAADREEILRIKRAVHAAIAVLDCEHTTIEIEYADEECGLKG